MRHAARHAVCAALLAVDLAGSAAIAQEGGARPNILLIVGDDVGLGDLGFAGAVTRTPNIDRLAGEGALFTRFHASPVCSVTRAMLLTGADPVEVGLAAFDYALYPPAEGHPGYEAYLTRNAVTVAELLQEAGYFRAMVGKWRPGGTRHGGEGPHEWGFDRSYSIYTGGANHWNSGVFHVDMNEPEQKAAIEAGRIPQEPHFEDGVRVARPEGVFSDTLWTNRMLGYLDAFIREMNLSDVHIIGPDVGMSAALQYAIHHKHRLKSLMIGAGPGVAPSSNGSVIDRMINSAFWRMVFRVAGAPPSSRPATGSAMSATRRGPRRSRIMWPPTGTASLPCCAGSPATQRASPPSTRISRRSTCPCRSSGATGTSFSISTMASGWMRGCRGRGCMFSGSAGISAIRTGMRTSRASSPAGWAAASPRSDQQPTTAPRAVPSRHPTEKST
ncbi:Sulfatase [Rubrimonas cliftonensis]|uniref:Sulfatase n=1 Tax=Rubrimonas cliftonensis TaxID=89524 RepID=A0A1H4FEE2_9RHOB|nr:Sulfatase [Rubrimonas cliftonensis]